MFIKSTVCMLCIGSFIFSSLSSADPLLLTPTEMQKLKKYFPNDEANTDTVSTSVQQNNDASASQVAKEADNQDAAVKNNNAAISSSSINNTDSSSEQNFTNALSEGDTYVALTRYAWQQLYGPPRLFSNLLSIHRVPMEANTIDAHLIYGDKVYAHPLAAWSFNHVYITAVQLRNKYPHATNIRIPQDICGDWSAVVTYLKTQLAPAGDKLNDSATLFLLSHQPYAQASEICHVSA